MDYLEKHLLVRGVGCDVANNYNKRNIEFSDFDEAFDKYAHTGNLLYYYLKFEYR